ncbi:MAG: hypothetical protein ACLFM8_04025 [Halobacteriales archaeon]
MTQDQRREILIIAVTAAVGAAIGGILGGTALWMGLGAAIGAGGGGSLFIFLLTHLEDTRSSSN